MKTERAFIVAALVLLLSGMLFGCLGAVQYVLPEFLAKSFSFNKVRPMHVSLVISWIFLAASGCIYAFLPRITKREWFSNVFPGAHLMITLSAILLILICYVFGIFGGKEYWEFPPVLSLLLAIGWIFFLINFFKTVVHAPRPWPVYLWMWSTGISFFLFTFIEQYLWLIPWFRDNLIRDIVVQWKSMGAIVGSWNMLVYGIAFYLMEQISGSKQLAQSPKVFFFYFLGLTNLLFNWGHHTYIVPSVHWIRDISYLISMTELLILGKIIFDWRTTLSEARMFSHRFSYRLLIASDVWIFLNLALAILMSVPYINRYTHGTHITVAHAMGTTIGINTMILLAGIYFFTFEKEEGTAFVPRKGMIRGYWLSNVALGIFWLSLIGSGIVKAMMSTFNSTSSFYQVLQTVSIFMHVFTAAGIFLLVGIGLLVVPLIRDLFQADAGKGGV